MFFKVFLHKDANLKKLFTSEDKFYLHKIFGFLSILSFFYRYGFVYNKVGTLGFDGSKLDSITLLIHLLTPISSVIFRVPAKRIQKKPMIIYKEYRLHAIVFTLRCFSVYFSSIIFKKNRSFYLIPIIVAIHHLLADLITYLYGNGSTAVRTNSENLSPFYKKVSLFYSLYQFFAIASHLLPNDRISDLAWNPIVAIASSAFLMTLYKKRIIRGMTHLFVYSFCLLLSLFHIIRLIGFNSSLLTFVIFLLRINLPKKYSNKYVLWTIFLLVSKQLNFF